MNYNDTLFGPPPIGQAFMTKTLAPANAGPGLINLHISHAVGTSAWRSGAGFYALPRSGGLICPHSSKAIRIVRCSGPSDWMISCYTSRTAPDRKNNADPRLRVCGLRCWPSAAGKAAEGYGITGRSSGAGGLGGRPDGKRE
ncbi:hypothetical protein KB20921_11640 [Edwardsiella ictaluri]|nr:hypothetical protein KH20906_11320 [Edwardsiella ictaluri]BEI01903.1 hypothetical protein KB20921_11640 [Edwardsiella ictaluri]BEI05371.1 hypothetical protein KH201010_11570 [Edwardsiella ictaluri]BEI08830.1 hypothetical protein STU22726_11610 [Edwardsiella ictaluri]BEI12309.1 hypothetical protein STU22816_11620 [Edwardsiella ictaluri]